MDDCTKVLSWERLLLVMRITGGITAVLSILGASLIVFTYAAYKNLRTTARQLLLNLSIADIIVSGSHFVGILQDYKHDLLIQSSVVNDTMHSTNNSLFPPYIYTTNALCDTQAAFTAIGTVASFLWSMLIAVYMLVLTQSTSAKLRKVLVPIIYIICWGIPIVIMIGLAALKYLGYNPYDSPVWCYTKQIEGLSEVAQNILSYDLWLYLAYFFLFFLYALLYCCIRCPSCKYSHKAGIRAARGDVKLLFVPLIFLLLRIWSSIIDVVVHFSAESLTSKFFCSPVSDVIIVLSVIGANGQGLANAILFCGFTKNVRKRLWASSRTRCLQIKRLLCCCCSSTSTSASSSSEYDELADSDDLNENASVSRSGTQYGLLNDFSKSTISNNSLQVSQ